MKYCKIYENLKLNEYLAAINESSAKELDDFFRKTKATPSIYWLPLTEEQV